MLFSTPTSIPSHAQILVVGGGPAGSYAAAALAREGFDVVVLEASQFPRYHIGESLIPSVRHYLRFIDAEEKVANHGFAMKPGSAIKFNQYKKEGYTDFVALGHDNAAWNVIRSEFDHLLLDHAASLGAKVYENTRVISLEFDENDKPASAAYTCRSSSGASNVVDGTITFKYLVDATGRAGLVSTKYLKNRNFTESLKNIAIWGYWAGVGSYGEGTARAGAPWFEALTDESGWAWFIPLHTGVTSVGIVVNKGIYAQRVKSHSDEVMRNTPLQNQTPRPIPPSVPSSTRRYLETLELAPGLKKLLGDGKLVDHLGTNEHTQSLVHTASDYSYSADRYAGEGWRVIGDAGAFIDPFFSSGIHLAFTGALSAAVSISASIRGECSEKEAVNWHTERVATSFTRFLVVVLSAYKQMKSQRDSVLSDIGEDNFDRAFKSFRPVIQGGSDMGRRLSEDELQQALDFCGKLFAPTSPDEHRAAERFLAERLEGQVAGNPNPENANLRFLDVRAPIIDQEIIETIVREQHGSTPKSASDTNDATPDFQSNARNPLVDSEYGEWDMKTILDKVNARRVIHSEHGNGVHNFEYESLGQSGIGGGWVARLEKGRLGLVRTDTFQSNKS
ncbi:FAD/NAD(P)-binding domain-containing protein [Thelephora ganbajun]|uniref:FAD/NAD(P)-binding domain-containing protein n=1 Tax=Thelephora ganbajun TaxID=370292 RepID=A0ACB6ZRD5_THEGA|nr:FAD/NAD(P)-binding domain-containing protein [Thelephora ganbajun]